MARGISKGDKVRICMNENSYLSGLANMGAWIVVHTPYDVGDVWTLERDGQIIEIGSCSANFDGLELVEHKEATNAS